jgi:hypothetical protein
MLINPLITTNLRMGHVVRSPDRYSYLEGRHFPVKALLRHWGHFMCVVPIKTKYTACCEGFALWRNRKMSAWMTVLTHSRE